MKCPHCGYDKIQPNFNFCPKCKRPLKEQKNAQPNQGAGVEASEKGFINRAFSRWTYERAMADPYGYAVWAYRNPNDNRVFLERWNREGHDLTIIRQAISEANRARQENPTADDADVDANIIDSNRESARRESNRVFIESVNAEYTTDAATIVRNKAIWKLQPGELARHIAPDEWVYVSEHLEGLVIEEGTTAIIYIDGQETAQMGSGMYVFDDKHAAAAELEAQRREGEKRGFFGRIADGLYRFFTGHKREESAQERQARSRRVEQIIGKLKKDTIIDVYLKSDRIFPAIFGQQHLSDTPEGYQPYIIQSRYLDLQVGVSMQMQIGNFKDFIANYMAGKKAVTIADVVKSADSSVFSILRFQLRDIEVSERGLDEVTFNAIKDHLKRNLPNVLYGVVVVDVLDIATTNEQLARFRKVEEQLYCSEREYDFLRRTNEFRNRIASEENDQKIREARSEQELRIRLDEVNKDNLLHDEEIAQFVQLLSNQTAIREATNKADLDRALNEIKRNSLISQDEFDIFNEDLQNRRFDREQVSEQMRARSLMATALQKLEVDKTLQVANIQNVEAVSEAEFEAFRKQKGREAEGWNLEAAIYGRRYVLEKQQLLDELEKKRIETEGKNKIEELNVQGERVKDEYQDERKLKEHEIEEKIREDEYQRKVREKEDELRQLREQIDINMSATERGSRLAMENMRAMKEMELRELREQHELELEKAKLEADVQKAQIEAERNMSADQLLGKNVVHMDAAAQAKFAESFSHLNEVELTKANAQEREKLYQQMLEMAKDNNLNTQQLQSLNSQQQMQMMQQVLAAMSQMNANQMTNQQGLVNSMVGVMRDVTTGKVADAQKLKEEYRTQMQHEQARVDENQQQALNYTSRVKVSENTPFVAGGTSVNVNVGGRTCPICGEQITDKDAKCCPICGNEL